MRVSGGSVLALSLALGSAAAGQNLVANGGFEKPEKPHVSYDDPYTWVFYVIAMDTKAEYDEDVKKSGKHSYKIANGKSGRGFVHSRPFTVKPGARYRLRVWAKAEGAPDEGVLARVFWYVGKPGIRSEEREYDDTVPTGGTFDWTELKLRGEAVTSPKDATCAYIRLDSNDGGKELAHETEEPFTVWFDDVVFQELK